MSEDGVPSASYDHMGAEKQLNFSTTRGPTGGRTWVQVPPPPGTHPSLLKRTGKPAIREPIPGQVLAFPVAFAQGGFPHLCTFALLFGFRGRGSQVPQSLQESAPLEICGAGGRCSPPPEYDSLFLVQRLFPPRPQGEGM